MSNQQQQFFARFRAEDSSKYISEFWIKDNSFVSIKSRILSLACSYAIKSNIIEYWIKDEKEKELLHKRIENCIQHLDELVEDAEKAGKEFEECQENQEKKN